MITLSNGHRFEYMVASGALAFDGRGWFWDRPLVWLGLIRPELFTVVLRTLTLKPRPYPVSNLSWVRPWTWFPWSSRSCVQFLPNGGAVNKVGLYNLGIDWWCQEVGPYLDFEKYPLMASIQGTTEELVAMAPRFNPFAVKAVEVNVSCPNSGHPMEAAEYVIQSVHAVKQVTPHPVLAKLSVDQQYLQIAEGVKRIAEAIDLNSVPWATWAKQFSGSPPKSPVDKIGQPGSGSGGVSGRPAQAANWKAVKDLAEQGSLPVIGPSVMEFADIERVRKLGARAVSFGTIHLRTPWRPTAYVKREMKRSPVTHAV